MNRVLPLLSLLAFAAAPLSAQSDPKPAPAPTTQEPAPQEPTAAEPAPSPLQKRMARYHAMAGKVSVGRVATLDLPEGWVWLDGEDGKRFLTEGGNRPGPSTLGVALPADYVRTKSFAVYFYSEEGHIDDSETPDYDQLLEQMKASSAEESKDRKAHGLQGVELVGWAEPPHYDKAQHKLCWAERLQFEGQDGETLNYNVRVLGRSGHLVVNAVGSVDQLPLVAEHSKQLLKVSEFIDGQRYEQFDKSLDKVAAYGLGGLIATGLALKTGLLAKLLLMLKIAIKPILVGLAVVGGYLARLFRGKKKKSEEAEA